MRAALAGLLCLLAVQAGAQPLLAPGAVPADCGDAQAIHSLLTRESLEPAWTGQGPNGMVIVVYARGTIFQQMQWVVVVRQTDAAPACVVGQGQDFEYGGSVE